MIYIFKNKIKLIFFVANSDIQCVVLTKIYKHQ